MSDVTAGQRSRRVVSFGQVQTGGIALCFEPARTTGRLNLVGKPKSSGQDRRRAGVLRSRTAHRRQAPEAQ